MPRKERLGKQNAAKKEIAAKGSKKITHLLNHSCLMKLCILNFPGTISHLTLFFSERIHNFHNITEGLSLMPLLFHNL